LATVIQHGVQGRIGSGFTQQTFSGRTERGKVWDFRQSNDTTKIGPLAQQDVRATIVELEKFFDHKTNHQLRLRELLGTFGFRMVRQTVTRCP
jgi:hypothetical protein